MDNYVSCNYYFYDSEGTSVSLADTLTVKTLLPGYKTNYIYRKLGYTTITLDYQDSTYINNGYAETTKEVRRDTILVNKLTNGTYFQLPMSYFNDEDTIVMSYSSISLSDTIKVRHDSYPHIELPECGAYRFHTLRNVTSTDRNIDKIEISNPKVDYDGNENIKIYFNGTAE